MNTEAANSLRSQNLIRARTISQKHKKTFYLEKKESYF